MSWLTRHAKKETLTIAQSAALSGEFEMARFTMATVYMPAAWTSASLGLKAAEKKGGTYLPLYDCAGDLVQISSPTASKAYTFPPEAAAAQWMKLWSQDGTGTNTTQGGSRTLYVDLKS